MEAVQRPAARGTALIGLVLAMGLALAAPQGALASADGPPITADPASGQPGDWVTVTGSGFPTATQGQLHFGATDVGRFRTNRHGDLNTRFRIPRDATPGTYVIVARIAGASSTTGFTIPGITHPGGSTPPPDGPGDPVEVNPPDDGSSESPDDGGSEAPTEPDDSEPTAPGDSEPTAPDDEDTAGDRIIFGVSPQGGWWSGLGRFDALEAAVGQRAGIFLYFQGWAGTPAFPAAELTTVTDRGATPMLTWEPWDHTRSATNQRNYRLARIIDGAHDTYIRSWATQARDWGRPVHLRFAHEMNGDWYPWSETTNGNRTGEYARAWRHIHDIFTEVGATNVSFVWTPNVPYAGSVPMAGLYPGDDYVDWVGLDGYNWGTSQSWSRWQSFTEVFEPGLAEIAAIAPGKPIVIGETASAEAGGEKAAWIHGMFDRLESADGPRIDAFIWFDHDKETDWRVSSSPAALDAFAQRVSDPRYER